MKETNVLSVPYQQLADSPTIRYYTDWKLFDPYIEKPSPPSQLSWSDALLNTLGLKPDTILKPGDIQVKPPLSRTDQMRILAFHANNLNAYSKFLVRDAEFTILIPKPKEGTLSAHLSLHAEGDSTVNLLLLSEEDSPGLDTITLDVTIDETSTLELNYLLFDSRSSPSAIFQEATLPASATLQTNIVAPRGKMLHIETRNFLKGPKARASTKALLAANKGSRITLVTDAEASAPNNEISVEALGFALEGLIVHKGFGRARRGCRDSRLKVGSKAILLSEQARAYAAPILEIESDDPLEASHSASQSPIDEEQVFYLQSRGFNREEAIAMIVRGLAWGLMGTVAMRRAALQKAVELLLKELAI